MSEEITQEECIFKKGRYPNTLFHYTKEKAALWGILENNFKISYARERIFGQYEHVFFAAPMVSFCDLRLSEATDHMRAYGNYGIGMTKEWAIKMHLNPVLYLSKMSHLTDTHIVSMGKFLRHIREEVVDSNEDERMTRVYHDLLNTYRISKNYEGDLIRKDGTIEHNYRFANEREWRYVPAWESPFPGYVPLENIETDERKDHYNSLVGAACLKFEPDDIRYLIIEDEHERDELIEHISNAKRGFDAPTVRRLSSRILTATQINEDI
ncbi:abortive infection system antitoxin AbiGi family protein [Rhodanobacter sp. C05]|uniref:abortive infection system antitoxin AbiGi family protein n=1 Tax=Rhodanobacter sp. C05 TaxID=1945855 RepID=UPI00117BCF98|nr:abortive infection system antitoxin AbiGi family protein [Rhodanobacter sp. C05]